MPAFNEARLRSLLEPVARAPEIGACFRALESAYTQPGRHYHGIAHIEECLELFDEFRALARDPLALELAIWFHDAIYVPGAKDNERASAAFARDWLERLGENGSTSADVSTMVEATARHELPPNAPPDCALMLDIDLASLALPEAEFARNTELIRREFASADERQFAEGRMRFLEAFLARDRIYVTDEFHRRFEDRARENLRRSITRFRTAADPAS